MAEFLSDLVFIVELFAVAAGFVLLDRAQKGNSGYLKVAGWLLVVGGIGAALCTGYYWLKYNDQGDFDRAYPPAMMQNMTGMGMKSGMMKMMHGERKPMSGMQQGGMNRGGAQLDQRQMDPQQRMGNMPEADPEQAEASN